MLTDDIIIIESEEASATELSLKKWSILASPVDSTFRFAGGCTGYLGCEDGQINVPAEWFSRAIHPWGCW